MGHKKLRTFFHETTKTQREVFGSHHGESLSSLLVKVAAAAAAVAAAGSAAAAHSAMAAARWRQRRGCDSGGNAMSAAVDATY